MCIIVIDEHAFEMRYEEMVELFNAIYHIPIRGNEYFDSTKEKAKQMMAFLPETDY